MLAEIIVVKGFSSVSRVTFNVPTDGKEVTIGREEPSSEDSLRICLMLAATSRTHCSLRGEQPTEIPYRGRAKGSKKRHREEETRCRIFLTDLNSSNGTLLNFKRIPSMVPTEVHDGDILIFGGKRDLEPNEELPHEEREHPSLVLWKLSFRHGSGEVVERPMSTLTWGSPQDESVEARLCHSLLMQSSRASLERMMDEGVISHDLVEEIVSQHSAQQPSIVTSTTATVLADKRKQSSSNSAAKDEFRSCAEVLDMANGSPQRRQVQPAVRQNSSSARAKSPEIITGEADSRFDIGAVRRSPTNNSMRVSNGDQQPKSASAQPPLPSKQIVAVGPPPPSTPFEGLRLGSLSLRLSLLSQSDRRALETQYARKHKTVSSSPWMIQFSDTHITWCMQDVTGSRTALTTISLPLTSISRVKFSQSSPSTEEEGKSNTSTLVFWIKEHCTIPFIPTSQCFCSLPLWVGFELKGGLTAMHLAAMFDACYGTRFHLAACESLSREDERKYSPTNEADCAVSKNKH